MIGFVIPCSFNNRYNIVEVCKFFYNKRNTFICLIVDHRLSQFLKLKNINNKNVKFITHKSKNVSFKRNLGIKFFLEIKKIVWISFLDSDCKIDKINFSKIIKYVIFSKNKILLVNLISPNGNKIGNNLRNYFFLNFLNIYRAGTPSIIIKKKHIKKLFDIKFGIGTQNYSAEDTKFLIDNFTYDVSVIKKSFIYHPDQLIDPIKISNYSYGQKKLMKIISKKHALIFFFMIILRPLFGLVLSILKLDTRLFKIYLKRIKVLVYE